MSSRYRDSSGRSGVRKRLPLSQRLTLALRDAIASGDTEAARGHLDRLRRLAERRVAVIRRAKGGVR